MRKQKYLYLLAALLLFTTSCTVYQKSMNTARVNVQMNITLSDMEYVGEVNGTATQSFVLGIPYGGRRYHYPITGFVTGTPLNLNKFITGNRGLNNAMWDALQQKPDADFLLTGQFAPEAPEEMLVLLIGRWGRDRIDLIITRIESRGQPLYRPALPCSVPAFNDDQRARFVQNMQRL